MTDKEAVKLVHEAIELACNFFDTAPNYGLGKSESILGEAFKGRRDEVIINSKCGHHTDDVQSFDPKRLIESVVQAVSQLIAGVKQSASEVRDASTQLSAVAEETSASSEEISRAISQIAAILEETAAATEEVDASSAEQLQALKMVTESAESLQQNGELLDREMSKFKTK